MTWTGWDRLRNLADENGIIYKRGDSNINPYIQAIDDLLMLKNATDVSLIFEDERGTFISTFDRFSFRVRCLKTDSYPFAELNQSLYYLIGNSIIRLVVIDEFTEKTVSKIRSMRPSPSYYAIYASTAKMEDFFRTVIPRKPVNRRKHANLSIESLVLLIQFSVSFSCCFIFRILVRIKIELRF